MSKKYRFGNIEFEIPEFDFKKTLSVLFLAIILFLGYNSIYSDVSGIYSYSWISGYELWWNWLPFGEFTIRETEHSWASWLGICASMDIYRDGDTYRPKLLPAKFLRKIRERC